MTVVLLSACWLLGVGGAGTCRTLGTDEVGVCLPLEGVLATPGMCAGSKVMQDCGTKNVVGPWSPMSGWSVVTSAT